MVYSPNILPRVLQCVNWKDRSAVFEVSDVLLFCIIDVLIYMYIPQNTH